MPTDDNNVVTTMVYIEQPLVFIQCNNFVSIISQLLALLNERSLVCFHSYLPHSVVSGTVHSFRSMGLIN